MLANMFARKALPLARQFGTTAVRRAHDTSGVMGSTLPFGLGNKYMLVAGFIVFFGSGLAVPFLSVRRQLLIASS